MEENFNNQIVHRRVEVLMGEERGAGDDPNWFVTRTAIQHNLSVWGPKRLSLGKLSVA